MLLTKFVVTFENSSFVNNVKFADPLSINTADTNNLIETL